MKKFKTTLLALSIYINLFSFCLVSTSFSQTIQDLKEQARQLERDGQFEQAAVLYGQLVHEDESLIPMLVPHLVKLYIKSGNEEQAIRWAHVEMERNPQPMLYMAGVHQALKQNDEAVRILIQQLQKLETEEISQQKMFILWQLADINKQNGDEEGYEACLRRAVACAPEGDKSAAEKRLKQFLSEKKQDVSE